MIILYSVFPTCNTSHFYQIVKIESLPMKRKRDGILENPRPEKFRKMEGYTDFVRNVMVNYCAHTSQDLALRYIFPPANLQVPKN